MATDYSLDSQPYAIAEDPRKLQVVSIPGRLALIQRMEVDIGTAGINPPNRLRMYLRSEGSSLPVAPLQVQVTGTNGVDLVEQHLIQPDILERPRVFQWVELELVPIGAGFGTVSDEREVLVWFVATEAGLGWEVAALGTGEAYPELRGPVDPVNPQEPVFGNLLTYPAAIPTIRRLIGSALVPQVGPVEAGTIDAGAGDDPHFASQVGSEGFISQLTRGVSGGFEFLGMAQSATHVFYSTSRSSVARGGTGPLRNVRATGGIRKVRKSDMRQTAVRPIGSVTDFRSMTTTGNVGLTCSSFTPSTVFRFGLGGSGDAIGTVTGQRRLNPNEGPGQVIVNDGTHAYIGTRSSPARLVKVRISDMVRIQGVVFPTNEDRIQGMTLSGTTLYAALDVPGVRIAKVATGNLTIGITALRPGTGSRAGAVALNAAGTIGACVTTNGFLIRFDTATMAVTGVAEPVGPALRFRGVKLDEEGRYAYGIADSTPAVVQRWYFEGAGFDLQPAGRFTFANGNNGALNLELESQRIFAGFRSSRLGRVENASTAVSVAEPDGLSNRTLFRTPWFDGAENAGIVVNGSNVWLAQRRNPARVSRYNLAGARQATALQTAEVAALAVDGTTDAYSIMAGGLVRQMQALNLQTVAEEPLLATEPNSVFMSANELMIGTSTSPAEIVRVDRTDLTTQSLLTLSAGEGPIVGVTGDSDNAYFLTGVTPPQVIKVDLATNTVVDILTLDSFLGPGRAITRAGDLLYCLCLSDPARVAVVDREGPSDPMTNVSSLNLQPNEVLGSVIISDGTNVFGGVASRPGRIFRVGVGLSATGLAHAIQFDDDAQLSAGLDYARNFREDADVAIQFGNVPDPPDNFSAVFEEPEDEDEAGKGCVDSVEISWDLPDDECALVFDGGFVEVQRQISSGPFETIFRVFGDVTRTVTDFECARNAQNRYRLRIRNDAGFESIWTDTIQVETRSECCGYQFASNQVPAQTVWYDDIAERTYDFPADVTYLEFEGRDGSQPLRVNADRLDEFRTELMVAGFGVFGGTAETSELETIGRRLFDPLLWLTGNKRGPTGELLRLPYLSVADNRGNVWRAEVEVDQGRTVATAGRFSLLVRVREVTREVATVDISPESLAAAPDSPNVLPPLLDPNNLLGS